MDAVVLIPTYNERDNIALLLPRVLAHPGFRVVVIDDASPDGTGDVAEQVARTSQGRVEVLHRTSKDGLGRAYVAGMRHALRQAPDFICHMDADGSHDADDLPRLAAAAANADLAIGSRYVPGGALVNWPWYRRALSAGANLYVRATIGLPVHDCTAGFRCWRRDLLATIDVETLKTNGYAFQVETLWRATAAGARITEVPIVFTERREGRSKMSARVMVEAAALPWRLRGMRRGPSWSAAEP
jgi:dolichol-phosphate mannosyltransferase